MDEQNNTKINQSNEPAVGQQEELLEGADEARELKKKLEESEAKCAEYLSGWQRAKADFANSRKEEIARFEEFAKYANQDILKEFISVLDSFDLAVAALEKSGPVEKGVYMIRAQIEDLLKRRGLEQLDVKIGSEFDPNFAEAVAETESEKFPGKIVEIVEQGYKLYGKVIRPARVIVGKITNR